MSSKKHLVYINSSGIYIHTIKILQFDVLFFLILFFKILSLSHFLECILPLKPDWTFYSPLIFTLNGTLISTENTGDDVEDITLSAGTEVLLSCTPNYFRDNPAEKSIRAICKEDLTLRKYIHILDIAQNKFIFIIFILH